MTDWTFFSNHGHVLLCLLRNPDVRVREIAAQVGITERAAQGIVTDLIEGGYVLRTREGRRNHYDVNTDERFRHPMEADHRIGEVFEVLTTPGEAPSGATGRAAQDDERSTTGSSVTRDRGPDRRSYA